MNINRAALKQRAREAIRTARPNALLVTLVYLVLITVLPLVVNLIIPNPVQTLASLPTDLSPEVSAAITVSAFSGLGMLSFFISLLITLFTWVMQVGYSAYALRLRRGQEAGYQTLFDYFHIAGRVILANLLTAIFSGLWTFLFALPYSLLLFLFAMMGGDTILTVVVVVALTIVFVVFLAIFLSRYALVNFLLADRPSYTAMDSIRESKVQMRGRCSQYFVLQLSFIGWYLIIFVLASIALSISTAILMNSLILSGTSYLSSWSLALDAATSSSLYMVLSTVLTLPLSLWLEPYIAVTNAGFYETVYPMTPPPVHEQTSDPWN